LIYLAIYIFSHSTPFHRGRGKGVGLHPYGVEGFRVQGRHINNGVEGAILNGLIDYEQKNYNFFTFHDANSRKMIIFAVFLDN